MYQTSLVFLVLLLFAKVKAKKDEKGLKECEICGRHTETSSENDDGRTTPIVVNGTPLGRLYKYPWMASLSHFKTGKDIFCTAALITKNYILTAAHCLENGDKCWDDGTCNPLKYLEASAFYVNIWRSSAKTPWKSFEIEKAIPHPDYKSQYSDNVLKYDIAVLKLKTNMICSYYSNPICLPKKDIDKMDGKLHIAGWGFSTTKGEDGSEKERVLREGTVKQVKAKTCMKSKKESEYTSTIVCAVASESKQIICQGDSGSSIFADFNGSYYSLGVTSVSESTAGCPLNSTSLYTKNFEYLKWIKGVVGKLPSEK